MTARSSKIAGLAYSRLRQLTQHIRPHTTAMSRPDPSQLRNEYDTKLHTFASSTDDFQILTSIPSPPPPSTPLKTLYVLDSSFNPPSHAHLTLASQALKNDKGPRPARMLLLLATVNADKPTKPAPFADRLAMMTLLAHGLRATHPDSPVDIAVTKKPFFMDKAAAIDDSGVYGAEAQQVHLTGYDTIVRIFNAKYYPEEKGLSVLEPFLGKHRLRVCYRTAESEEDEDGDEDEERRKQERYVEGIGDGSREAEGMRREWREMVELVDDATRVKGVSSTKARQAAVDGRREELERIVGPDIAEFVMQRKLYDSAKAVEKKGIQPRE